MNLFRTLASRLSNLIRREHWFAEFWSGTVAVLWAIWNATAGTDLHTSLPYELITRLLSAGTLESIAVVVGLSQLYFLLYGPWIGRAVSAFVSCWFYSLFLVSFLAADTPQPGTVFVLGWVGVNVFAVVRLTNGFR